MADSNKHLRPDSANNQRAFLAAYAELGTVTQAAVAAGIDRSSHTGWLKDPEYRRRFADAKEQAGERLEAEARRRAVEGCVEPVFGSGGQGVGTVEVGNIRKFSDVLLIFLMKGAMPDKYRERRSVEHSGNMVHEIKVVHDDEWYGNNAHALTSEGVAASNSGAAIAGENESVGMRQALGQDGDGNVGGD